MKKGASAIAFASLLIGMMMASFNIQPVEGSSTIYIRADGSIDPSTANISSADNVTYTFTDNNYDEIVVQRSNIIIDGGGYTLRSPNPDYGVGVYLTSVGNVTIRNVTITLWNHGIAFDESSNITVSENNITANNWYGVNIWDSSSNTVVGNTITNNSVGVYFVRSDFNIVTQNTITDNIGGVWFIGKSSNNTVSENNISTSWFAGMVGVVIRGHDFWGGVPGLSCNNTISGNNITNSHERGIMLSLSANNNTISENKIADNEIGIELYESSNYNTIYENKIADNSLGVYLEYSSNNTIYHNNLINNTQQVHFYESGNASFWDDGYPSGGNYWSDYAGNDSLRGPNQDQPSSDGIGDTPYVIDASNQDNYPLMDRYKPHVGPHDIGISRVTPSKDVVGQGSTLYINVRIKNYGNYTENSSITVYYNTTNPIATKPVTLSSENSTTITFTWNTTGIAKGNYTISAYATPVLNETDTTDNTLIDGWAFVTIPGDADGDRDVDIYDITMIADAYDSREGDARYVANCDWDGDGDIDIYDIVMAADNYDKSW